MIKIDYLESPGRFAQGDDAYLGKWRIGWVGWDASGRRDDPKKYKVTCALPGIKDYLGNFATPVEARARLEAATVAWIEGAGLIEGSHSKESPAPAAATLPHER